MMIYITKKTPVYGLLLALWACVFSCSSTQPKTESPPRKETISLGAEVNYSKTEPESELELEKNTDSLGEKACPDTRKTFLWKIQGKSNTVYLLGSIHVGTPQMYPLSPNIMQAWDSSAYLVLEVNPKSQEFTQKMQSKMAEAMASEKSLKNSLSEPTYQLLKDQAESFGLNMKNLDKVELWVITLMMQNLQFTQMGILMEYGIDSYFLDLAHKSKDSQREVLELETVDFQMDLLSETLNTEEFLLQSINSLKSTKLKMDLLIQAWACGDTGYVRDFIFNEMDLSLPQNRDLFTKLFDERNKSMAQKISEYLSNEKNYFVVVGAGHLIGDNNIRELLIKKGFTVEQL